MVDKTYLELSEDDGVAHKFYEVSVDGCELTVRYGRIGTQGQTKTSRLANVEKARAEAQKKLAEKRRKGYAPAVIGQRKKRPVTHRPVESQRSNASTGAPILWQFKTRRPAFGIFVDPRGCWMGNQSGEVYQLSLTGETLAKFQLPEGVKCLVADDMWLYCGCDDGKVYDLSGKLPFVAYEIDDDVNILWLDIRDGLLGIGDTDGYLTLVNHDDESQWRCRASGRMGWMVRCDELGIYYGDSDGVTMFDWEDGTVLWQQPTRGSVLFGWQEESAVYAATALRCIQRFAKRGVPGAIYECDAPVYACATAEDGRYLFAGDNSSSVYCFAEDGRRLWKLATPCGSALSMQYFDEKLYFVTTSGQLACMDVAEGALTRARRGELPQARQIQQPAALQATAPVTAGALETAASNAPMPRGVVVECREEAGQLRIYPVSAGYRPHWRVQFPKNLRQPKARYWVAELREARQGGFYRALGDIKRLAD